MKATLTAKVRREYKTFTREFNDRRHMNNYMEKMRRSGYHFIGIEVHNDEGAYVQAQEEAYFDNFCQLNNI